MFASIAKYFKNKNQPLYIIFSHQKMKVIALKNMQLHHSVETLDRNILQSLRKDIMKDLIVYIVTSLKEDYFMYTNYNIICNKKVYGY